MTTSQLMHEIEELPPDDQAELVRFAYRLDAERKLTGSELSALAARMTAAADPCEVLKLREEIMRGFYGGRPHA